MARGDFGSTMNAPSSPRPTCFAALWCEWYMCEPELPFGTVNSYVNDSPGLIGGCVMNGTPSWSIGSSSPWKWIAVDSGSLFVQHDPHAVAFAHADLRTRHLSVVRHGADALAGRDLPLHFSGGELVDLHAVVDAWRRAADCPSLPSSRGRP